MHFVIQTKTFLISAHTCLNMQSDIITDMTNQQSTTVTNHIFLSAMSLTNSSKHCHLLFGDKCLALLQWNCCLSYGSQLFISNYGNTATGQGITLGLS